LAPPPFTSAATAATIDLNTEQNTQAIRPDPCQPNNLNLNIPHKKPENRRQMFSLFG